MVDFFISYAGKNEDWAQWIAWSLDEAGYSTILQKWDFKPGANFVLCMDKAAKPQLTLPNPLDEGFHNERDQADKAEAAGD